MAEPITIITALAGIRNGFEVARAVRDEITKGKIDPTEVSNRLLLLQQIMLDTQAALSNAAEDLRNLKSQLDTRKELEADKVWEKDGGFYVRKSDQDGGRFIPYCPVCWQTTSAAVPMPNTGLPGEYKCALHEPVYRTATYERYARERDDRLRNGNPRRGGGPNSWM